MNLYESIKKNLNESEKLKESDYKIWSNHGQEEYYENMSREEMIKEIKASGWDEEEINGKPILSADDEDLREYLVPQDVDLDYEDYENSILPMIEKQCYGDYLVLMGKAANWRGRGEASKAIKTSELKDYFFPNYDAIIQLYCDNQDNLYYTEANHDTPMGGTEMYLYSFKDETSYNNAEKLLQELYEDESWDMYYFCDWLGYSDAEELIERGYLTPVKRDPQYVGKVNESEKLKESEKDVKDQIRFVCKHSDIPIDEEFINFVYNKHLDAFSGEIMKKLKEEFDKSKTKNEADESNEQKVCSICGATYTGYGNSAWPINSGYCCDTCNYLKVIPARLAQLRKSDEANNKNIKESTLINKNTEDFEDLVKRDFQNYIEDTYNIQNVQELADRLEHVTEEDINNYFTSLFYEIFDYDDMETANLAEDIIRKEYGFQDGMNESEEKNNVVKAFKNLPYQDFKAENTIGILNDGAPFIVFDDNMVYIFDEQMTLDELKNKVYKSDDELNKYFEDHCKALDDNEKATHILVEIGRLNDDALNESEEKHFEEISSKSVRDSDGFTTDYTLYKDLDNNRYVCVFGDKEMYKPEDENFDFISDYEEEAKEWFNEYNGFEDDDDEYWEDHNDDPIECTIEYDEEGKPYFMYNNEKEYIDEYMKDGAGGATKQLTAFSAIRIVPSDNGETVSVQYLHDSEEVKKSADDFETFQDKNAEKINKEYFKRYGKIDENKIDRKLWEEIANELYKKMNKNINESASIDINNLTKEQLWKLRQEIVLGSLYANDYNNSFGIDPSAVRNFFDSFIEDSQVDDYGKPNNRKTEEYDNADDLYNFYTSCENPFGEVEDINEAEEKGLKESGEDDDFWEETPYKGYIILRDEKDGPYRIFEGGRYTSNHSNEGALFQVDDADIYRKIENNPYARIVIDAINDYYNKNSSLKRYLTVHTNKAFAEFVIDAMNGDITSENYKSYLNKIETADNMTEAEEPNMTITQYAKTLDDNYIDQDVCDTDIDMMVALVYDFNEEPTDYYNKFIKALCDKTKIEKISDSVLVCRFTDVFRPYNEECEDIFNMENSEFRADEAYYEAVANLEPLIAGYAGESTYKDMYDLLNGNYKIGNNDKDNNNNNMTEAETYANKKELTDDEILQAAKYVLNNNKDLSKVFGWNNFVENAIWNYLKDKKGLKKFPSNLYKRIRKVIYNSPEFEKFNEAEETKHKDAIQVYMNTRKNYDAHGADLDTYGIKDGWMNPDDALKFCEKYEEDGPFINDIDNNSDINIEISENDNVYSVLEGLAKLNDVLYFGAGNAEKGDVPLVYEAWSDRESVSTPSLENIEEFIDFLENGEYYVHNDITSTYDIGKYYVDNVGFEGVSNIENYIDTDKVKEDWQEEIDNDYLDDDGNPTEDWFEVDDSIVEDDIESAKQSNNTDFFDKYFDYESLGDEIYGDGYWYLTDNGSVEIY